MKITIKKILGVFSIALLLTTSAFADIPRTINYQGKLTDSESRTVDDGSYSITFNLYEQEAGGAPIWFEDQTIVVQKGIFSTQIGATKDLNLTFDKPYWLGIKVGADSEMSPRQPLSSTAYAFTSEFANNADKLNNVMASSIPSSNSLIIADEDGFLHTPPTEPDDDYEVVNKKYVDDKIASIGGVKAGDSLKISQVSNQEI